MTRRMHFDISNDAFWRSLCGATPTANGENLTIADEQVTCRVCLRKLGYRITEAVHSRGFAPDRQVRHLRGDPVFQGKAAAWT